MSGAGLATLPMYDFPDARRATDAWWAAVAEKLRTEGVEAPDALLRGDDLFGQWRDPNLVLSQTCGYILTHQLRGELQPVATPHYTAAGCEGPRYASVILVRENHPGRRLEDFRGGVAVYSRTYSHAGYNAFRGMVAPLANGRPFFGRVEASDSHLGSIAALGAGRGDIATVDCLVYAFVQRWRPDALAGTRALGFTPPAPAPPYVAPLAASRDRIVRLRAALQAAARDPGLASLRSDLFIGGFSDMDMADYEPIARLEIAAQAAGYAELR